jgi:hypothetical protein
VSDQEFLSMYGQSDGTTPDLYAETDGEPADEWDESDPGVLAPADPSDVYDGDTDLDADTVDDRIRADHGTDGDDDTDEDDFDNAALVRTVIGARIDSESPDRNNAAVDIIAAGIHDGHAGSADSRTDGSPAGTAGPSNGEGARSAGTSVDEGVRGSADTPTGAGTVDRDAWAASVLAEAHTADEDDDLDFEDDDDEDDDLDVAAKARLDDALRQIDVMFGRPPAEQVSTYTQAHQTLQSTLARIDND